MQYKDLSTKQLNSITQHITIAVANHNKLRKEDISVKLWQGSLVVQVDADERVQLPNDQEMMEAIGRGVA